MELPAKVLIFTNLVPELNAKSGLLISIAEEKFYEIQVQFREKRHTVLLPVNQTVLIFEDPLLDVKPDFEIER